MRHRLSAEDETFVRAFEACRVEPSAFDHRAHVRLAYCYLCLGPPEGATARMKESLRAFLGHMGAGEGKFHETITRAWILAVAHFMDQTSPCGSAEEFIAANPPLLDPQIMLTHYSAEVLFSPSARQSFVPPDLQAIPPRGAARDGTR